MGWFWQKGASSAQQTALLTPSSSTTDSHASAPQAAVPPAPSRDESADAELARFLSMIQSESREEANKPVPNTNTTATASPTIPPVDTRTLAPSNRPSAASAAINESTLPTDMSCKDAFDYAWHCNTPASQFNAVYRYGGVRSCSDLWDDFWFCMRTKSYSPEMRAEAIRAHFRARENEKYYGAGKLSSEDVWESRDEKVAPGTAFRAPFDDPREDDTEWRLQEIERRRKIRDQMFGKD